MYQFVPEKTRRGGPGPSWNMLTPAVLSAAKSGVPHPPLGKPRPGPGRKTMQAADLHVFSTNTARENTSEKIITE